MQRLPEGRAAAPHSSRSGPGSRIATRVVTTQLLHNTAGEPVKKHRLPPLGSLVPTSMLSATKVPGESTSIRVSPASASNPMDVMAGDAFRQFFSTDVRGKAPLGFAAFFMDCALLPPERRSHRLWLVGEVCCVFAGLMLFFASTVPDLEATDNLGVVATCIGSFAVLGLVVACIFSASNVMMCSTPDLTCCYVGCKMMGWAMFYLLNGTILTFAAFVLHSLARANGALLGWIVCGMGIALFVSVNVFCATTLIAFFPLPQFHQQAWYYQAFGPNLVLSNWIMGRRSMREGADIQLAKMLAGPIPDDLRLVLDGGPGA